MSGMRRDELNRKVCVWMFCDGIAEGRGERMGLDIVKDDIIHG